MTVPGFSGDRTSSLDTRLGLVSGQILGRSQGVLWLMFLVVIERNDNDY
jgi:hypothetical protein